MNIFINILNTYDTFLPVIASRAENIATSKLALLESPAPKGTEEPIIMSRYGIGPKKKNIKFFPFLKLKLIKLIIFYIKRKIYLEIDLALLEYTSPILDDQLVVKLK